MIENFVSGDGQTLTYGQKMTLKLAISQEWIDIMNWFCAIWYEFRKAESCFNDLWVCVVKNRPFS